MLFRSVVERVLEEINGCLDHHRGEINRIKEREKEARALPCELPLQ